MQIKYKNKKKILYFRDRIFFILLVKKTLETRFEFLLLFLNPLILTGFIKHLYVLKISDIQYSYKTILYLQII